MMRRILTCLPAGLLALSAAAVAGGFAAHRDYAAPAAGFKRVEEMGGSWYSQLRGLKHDERLEAAAKANCQRLAKGPGQGFDKDLAAVVHTRSLRYEMERFGLTDAVYLPIQAVGKSKAELQAILASKFDYGRVANLYHRIGVAAFRNGDGICLTAIAAREIMVLHPIHKQAAPGDTIIVAGNLERGYSDPRLYVTAPTGEAAKIMLGQTGVTGFAGQISLIAGAGLYRFEIMAAGPSGPEVGALFSLYAGQAPPEYIEDGALAVALDDNQPLEAEEAVMLAKVNALRAKNRVRPLQSDARLAGLARAYSEKLAEGRFFGHIEPDGTELTHRLARAGIPYTEAYENLAADATAAMAEERLFESPAHLANLLEPYITHVGIGLARSPGGRLYVTQILARIPKAEE